MDKVQLPQGIPHDKGRASTNASLYVSGNHLKDLGRMKG